MLLQGKLRLLRLVSVAALALVACGENGVGSSAGVPPSYALQFVREAGPKLTPAITGNFSSKDQMVSDARGSLTKIEESSVTPQECRQALLDSAKAIASTSDGAEASVSSEAAQAQVSISVYKSGESDKAVERTRQMTDRCSSVIISLPNVEIGQKTTSIAVPATACQISVVPYMVARSETVKPGAGNGSKDSPVSSIPDIRTSYGILFARHGYVYEMQYGSPVGTPDRAMFDRNALKFTEIACSMAA
ncbi:hypothetical protein TSST111916_20440 [Tsukamurella strandjordii]|nr:hypothetical protein TTY48_24480 [Tsukamurella sp. TY48]